MPYCPNAEWARAECIVSIKIILIYKQKAWFIIDDIGLYDSEFKTHFISFRIILDEHITEDAVASNIRSGDERK